MYRKILVGYDTSDQAKDALALGKMLAEATGAKLVVGPVLEFDSIWERRDPSLLDYDSDYASQIKDAAKAANATVETIASSDPAQGLQALGQEIGV